METPLADTERRLLRELTRLDLDTEALVEAVADALDRLDRLLDAGGETVGLRETATGLAAAVAAHDAVELIGERGEQAAPHTHHVVNVTDADLPADAVVKVIKRGVRYRGNLLRPASVVVSSRRGTPS
jgi:molecular chaperone GrpE (heat shock protein)